MYILGLATMGESAAALLKDGQLVAAVEEERFSRHKHEGCFPLRSIAYCLKEEEIRLSDIDYVGVYWQPWRMWRRARGVVSTLWRYPSAFRQKLARSLRELSSSGGGAAINSDGSWFELFQVKQLLMRNFGAFTGKIYYLDHHRCHIASAFFASPFKEATILTFDGAGEEASTVMAVASGEHITVLRTIYWPHSLGHFYSAMTGFLGFKMLDGEYKMMGLAPYNSPEFCDTIRKHILLTDKAGSFRLNSRILDYHDALKHTFSEQAVKIFGIPRSEGGVFSEQHEKIASSVQCAFEEVVSDLALWAYKAGGNKKDICIAGGCGLNCTANGKLLKEGPFKRMYVPPAPHDAGGSIGAALLLYHEVLKKPRSFTMRHAYYGPGFSESDIRRVLVSENITAEPIRNENELLRKSVSVLISGGVLAWFQGRMEFGPRALGNRSFLADPRRNAIRQTINEKIKKRELFRPFAPSVKYECASKYFELEQPSPFMNIVVGVRRDKKNEIPATTHVDGTARVHTVSYDENPRYWRLLDLFEQTTGCPVLLNTSFNVNEPIVCTPEDALATFKTSTVDALVIGDFFITRDML